MKNVTELKINWDLKKTQAIAKSYGFKFDWNTKTWKHDTGVEMNEDCRLYKYAVSSKMSYSEAYEKYGFDFAEEGNY